MLSGHEALDQRMVTLEQRTLSGVEALEKRMLAGDERLQSGVDALRTDVAALRDRIAKTEVRAVLLYVTFSGAMLTAMARGFGWI
jgi:hypothetical protein